MSACLGPPDPIMVLGGKMESVTALVFDGGTQEAITLFSGHLDGQIIQWCPKRQRTVHSWKAHIESVLCLHVMRDCLISQGRDGLVKFWPKQHGQGEFSSIVTLQSAILTFCNCSCIDQHGQIVLSVPTDEPTKVNIYCLDWNALDSNDHSNISPSRSLQAKSVDSYGMCMKLQSYIQDDQSRLLVGYESGILALWNTLNGSWLSELKLFSDPVMSLTIWPLSSKSSPSNLKKGVSGSVSKKLISWRIEQDSLEQEKEVEVTNAGFNAVAIRADGRILATGGWDCAGRVFSVGKLKPLAVLTYHRQSVQCVAFSAHNTLALGGKDGYITLWDVYKNN